MRSRTADPPMHPLTRIGVGVVFIAFGGIVTASALGWINTLPGLLGQVMAFIGVICAIFTFVAIPHAELYWRRRDIPRLVVMGIFLIGAIGFDLASTERGIAYYFKAETARQQADAYNSAYAALQTQITGLQNQMNAVPAPDLSGGPRNDAQAISARESLIAPMREELNAKIAEQRALPRPVAPSDPLLALLLAAVAEAIVTLGLFAFDWKIPGMQLSSQMPQAAAPKQPRRTRARGSKGGNKGAPKRGKKPIDTAVIYQLHDANHSEREIAAKTGISKSHVNRMLQARRASA